MATTIDAVAVVTGGWGHGRSGRKLVDRAARACLEQAGLVPDDLDLIVNAGLYHDRNLGEPAMAALIQEDIGANPEDPHAGGHGTFSFDVANGACGMLTGLQLADGFLCAGTIRHALIIAGDAHPGRGLAPRFPFVPAGAAMACSWHEGPDGMAGFRFENRPSDAESFVAAVGLEHGTNQLRIDEGPGFAEEAASCAVAVASRWLADNQLAPEDIDLVVANPLTPAFLDSLAAGIGIERDHVVSASAHTRVHTAGLAVALHEASSQGRLAGASKVLLVSAGAGVTAGAALLQGPAHW